ncbi:MAG: DUF433 domain-containing protein [Pseudomonadota bacterium]
MNAPDLLARITTEPEKMGGRPCIRGMRLRVKDVLDVLAAGGSYEDVLEMYDELEREDILAALTYAARAADVPVVAAE